MKTLTSLTLLLAASAIYAQAPAEDRQLYLHAFRSPSIGLEYRVREVGIHAGLYTTILESGAKSTEFFKLGGTLYYGANGPSRGREFFLSAAYMRGQNRDYRRKDAGFIESGVRFDLKGGFEFRVGTGFLFARDRRLKVNPTIGISYRVPLNR